jgi:hypothetical protein
MKKIVHIKNVDSDSTKLLKSLMKFGKPLSLNKDTFTLKNVSQEDFIYLLALKEEVKIQQKKDIIISYE